MFFMSFVAFLVSNVNWIIYINFVFSLACQMRILQEFEGCRIEVVPEIKKDNDKWGRVWIDILF